MTFKAGVLLSVVASYLAILFLMAYAADRGWIPARIVRHPAVYTLSFGVYAASWSYYGSINFAAQQGFLYLAVYIGPTLAFILIPILWEPILRLIRDYQLTSVADLFAFRYSSQLAGILVTLFMAASTLPAIALQIHAFTASFRFLSQDHPLADPGLLFCVPAAAFAILFGARHISPREKHEGMALVIALESLVKLTALLAVALFALFGVFDGLPGLNRWLNENPAAVTALYEPLQDGPWLTLVFVSFGAVFLLPQQFHMGFVENQNTDHLRFAAWAFPLFLLLFSLATPLILWAAQTAQPTLEHDNPVLGVTQLGRASPLLTMLAFLGGLSAASGMIIVASLALCQMILKHVLLPASYPDPAVDMYRWLFWARRMLIAFVILAGYGLYLLLEHISVPPEQEFIAFVAAAQLLPGLAGVLFWRRATRAGFLSGLLAGGAVWYLTLLLPLLAETGFLRSHFNLMAWLGATGDNLWEFVTFWSLSLNTLLFVAVSLVTRQSAGESRAIAACFKDQSLLPGSRQVTAVSPRQFSEQLARIIGAAAAEQEVQRALRDLSMNPDESRPHQLRRLRHRIELNLSGMLGPMLARLIVDSRLQEDATTRSLPADHIRFIEDRLEQSRSRLRGLAGELDSLRRFHRQILEELPLGACALAEDHGILSWNQALERLSGIDRLTAIGSRAQELPTPWGDLLGQFLNQGESHIYKAVVTVQDRPRWLNLHKAAIGFAPDAEDPGQSWGGDVILVEDLTELQTLEAELVHSERLASIGLLAAGVAHEIGNPVTGIACIAQNLRGEDDPELIQESAEDILQQTRRISAIVQSLITFSHAGPVDGQRLAQFHLHDCVAEAQRLVRLSHTAKQINHVNACDPALIIEGDYQRLLQVFVNLLSNASDASQPGDRVQVNSRRRDDRVEIMVTDEGAGIPEELRERVFEPFFTTKEPGQGTGLGLSLVYNIIRDHGGSVRIESQLDQGARVHIDLPLRQRLPPRGNPPPRVQRAPDTEPDYAESADH